MIQKDKKIKRIFSSKISLFIIIFILIFLSIGLVRETYQKYKLASEIEQFKINIEKLEGNNQQLADLMDYFKDDSYLEKEARLKLNLKKPGETVVILSDNIVDGIEVVRTGSPEVQEPAEIMPEDNTLKTANYWKWWEYFFQS